MSDIHTHVFGPRDWPAKWQPSPLNRIADSQPKPAERVWELQRENETLRQMIGERDTEIGKLRECLEVYSGDSRNADKDDSGTL